MQAFDLVLLNSELAYEIALNMPLYELKNFCSTSQQYSDICRDEEFWRLRTQKDFPEFMNSKRAESWRNFYFRITDIVNFLIMHPQDPLRSNMTNRDVVKDILQGRAKFIDLHIGGHKGAKIPMLYLDVDLVVNVLNRAYNLARKVDPYIPPIANVFFTFAKRDYQGNLSPIQGLSLSHVQNNMITSSGLYFIVNAIEVSWITMLGEADFDGDELQINLP